MFTFSGTTKNISKVTNLKLSNFYYNFYVLQKYFRCLKIFNKSKNILVKQTSRVINNLKDELNSSVLLCIFV